MRFPHLLERFPLRELPPPETGVQLAQLDVEPQPLVGELVSGAAWYLAHRGVDVAFAGPTPVDDRIHEREVVGVSADYAPAPV